MKESDTAITKRVTKPKIFFEALHVRVPEGTKARIDALKGDQRQGDFVRELLEEAISKREKSQTKIKK